MTDFSFFDSGLFSGENHRYLSQFLTVAFIHLLAVASPGPDFAMVLRQSITHGTKTAMQTSCGLGVGILLHVSYSIIGIGVIISQSIVAFSVMKYLGAAYLCYIGVKAIGTKPAHMNFSQKKKTIRPAFGKAFITGLLTNGLNPKATLFFLSLFTVVIDHDTPIWVQAVYGVYMAFATAVWFSLLSLFFGRASVRRLFQRSGHWFERIMGASLLALGLKLAVTER